MGEIQLSLQILLFLSFFWLIWFTWKTFRPRNHHSLGSVTILVLGDIGRSPRMMYHAQSFAQNNFVTDLIGYGGARRMFCYMLIQTDFWTGSKPIPALESLPRVKIRQLPEIPKILNVLPFLVIAPIKLVHQTISILLCLLVWIDVPPEFILVQVRVLFLLISSDAYKPAESPEYPDSGSRPVGGANSR